MACSSLENTSHSISARTGEEPLSTCYSYKLQGALQLHQLGHLPTPGHVPAASAVLSLACPGSWCWRMRMGLGKTPWELQPNSAAHRCAGLSAQALSHLAARPHIKLWHPAAFYPQALEMSWGLGYVRPAVWEISVTWGTLHQFRKRSPGELPLSLPFKDQFWKLVYTSWDQNPPFPQQRPDDMPQDLLLHKPPTPTGFLSSASQT